MKSVVLLFFLLSLPLVAASQYDSLVHRPYADRIDGYFYLYQELIALKDSAAIARKVESVKHFSRFRKDRDLEVEMDLFLAYHNAFFKRHEAKQAIAGIRRVMALSEKEKIEHINIRAIRVLALYYWEQRNYELSFEHYMLLDKKLSATNVHAFPEMVRDLLKIGEAYYYFQDYEQAKTYFERIIRLPENDFNTMFMNSARNTLGLCYQKEKDYTRSDYYFNQILATTFTEPRRIWRRIAMGNLGANCYYRHQYDKAIPMLEYDLTGAVNEADYGPAAGAAILLADIFLSKQNPGKSQLYLQQARTYIEKAGQPERLQYLYPIISKWHGQVGNLPASELYLDSTVNAIKDHHAQFSAVRILRAQQKISSQEEKLKASEFFLEKQKKINERNLVIAVCAVLVVLLFLLYYVQKKNRLAKELKLKTAMQDLEMATLKLTNFTESITEKNKLIEKLQHQQSDEDRAQLVYQLQQKTILTGEDWISFQHLFDQAYPGFILRARQIYPELSSAELRYFVLAKLNISYRETASILGVSPNTIQVIRHRIRKKLGFSDNSVMEEAINSI